ncbi:MAG: glycosyltransferase 87 family protein [Actinomycetota bacterium]
MRMRTTPPPPPRSLPGRAVTAAVVAGFIGWIGVIWIGLQLAGRSPSSLGFDLELLMRAGRDVAAGHSPYAPELVAGGPPLATSLFYSYPPPVAQVFSLVAWVPLGVMLVFWAAGAALGFLAVTELLRRHLAPHRSRREVLLVALACAPLTLPFAVGVLFGNLDVWFPFLYGAMLLAAVVPGRGRAIGAGAALAVAALKLHPASIGVWFLARALRERRREEGRSAALVVGSAAAFGGLALVASVVIWGTPVWAEYGDVVRAGAQATIVDPRNAGIAAQLAALVGGGDALARSLHLLVGVAAVLITAWAALRRSDPVESFAWAAAASLGTLPVTWYHYPSALIPIAVAAMLRASTPDMRRVSVLVTAAAVVAAVALVWLPLLWLAAGLIVWSARVSAPRPADSPPSPAARARVAG